MNKFSELEYIRPDFPAFEAEIRRCTEILCSTQDPQLALTAFFDSEKAYSEIHTMITLAYIRNSMDTADEFYDTENRFLDEQQAGLIPVFKELDDAILSSPCRQDLEKALGSHLFHDIEIQQKLRSPAIIPCIIRESELCQLYSKTVAACSVEFESEPVNFYGLLAHMESAERSVRRRALVEWSALYEGISEKLDEIFDELSDIRVDMAQKLGLGSYQEMAYLNMGRDYGSGEVSRFRQQVQEVIVPAVAQLRQLQAKNLELDQLRYYDEELLFRQGNANPVGSEQQLLDAALLNYRELSPETGEFFSFLCEHGLYDLQTRKGKRPGGYCTELIRYKAPFIFSNFNGTSADIGVLTHEAGHAFAAFTASRTQPTMRYISSTSEINEIHSMAMEHFNYPYYLRFYAYEDLQKACFSHLWGALCAIPYLVAVDEFQHNLYQNQPVNAQQRRAVWREMEKKYLPWRDYDGISFLEQGGFWMQKQHIFLYPFYYIDYALAQVCAFDFYRQMKADATGAFARYLALCRAGGSTGYQQLLSLAGLVNPFEEGSVEKSCRHVIEELLTSPLCGN